MGRRPLVALTAVAPLSWAAQPAWADGLAAHADVRGVDVATADLRPAGGAWRSFAWDGLDATALDPGGYEIRFRADAGPGGNAVYVPACAGRGAILVEGRRLLPATPSPVVVTTGPGAHEIVIALAVSRYERRVACGEAPRAGSTVWTTEGLGVLSFSSRHAAQGGGQAVVYVPPRHDLRDHDLPERRPLLVGLHPWGGSMWTYAANAPLLREARSRDVRLLLPSGLGNSLYTADAEDEVMRAIDVASDSLTVDAQAISIWGASMGGAGATTIAFHRPDHFATVTSFFGDSKYDLKTYARFLLPNEAAAHEVNALDLVDNARSLPVWLIHGEQDRTSPVRQSALLAAALKERAFSVRFDRVPGAGHDGALVARFLPRVVEAASSARVAPPGSRVTYRSVRERDNGAYGVRFERASATGDAFVDVERRDDAVHVVRAEGVRAIVLSAGALGASVLEPPRLVVDDGSGVTVRWELHR